MMSALYFEFLALALDTFKAGADVTSPVPSFLVAGGPMRLQLCSTPHIPDPLLVDPRPSPLCAGTWDADTWNSTPLPPTNRLP